MKCKIKKLHSVFNCHNCYYHQVKDVILFAITILLSWNLLKLIRLHLAATLATQDCIRFLFPVKFIDTDTDTDTDRVKSKSKWLTRSFLFLSLQTVSTPADESISPEWPWQLFGFNTKRPVFTKKSFVCIFRILCTTIPVNWEENMVPLKAR